MKRYAAPLVLGAIGLLGFSAPAMAQARPYIFAGAGASIATGTFHDYAKTGWIAQAGVGADLGKSGTWIEAEGWFGSNKHSDVVGDKTNLLGGFGAIGHSFGKQKVHPYLVGALGFLQHKFVPKIGPSESETKFAYSAGGGLAFDLSQTLHFWVEGRYMSSTGTGATHLIPLTAGFSLNLGKK